MQGKMKYLVAIFCYNEKNKIEKVVRKFDDYNSYNVVIVDDGSTDGSLEALKDPSFKLTFLRNPINMGAGYSVRRAVNYAKDNEYDVIILVAGNNKDSPEDIYKLLKEIEDGYDFVQGSRYLPGGNFGNMPFYRRISTQFIHPFIFSLITGKRITDSTNGFRAIRVSMLGDKRIDLTQDWLDKYELEPYIFYKAIKLGYNVTEVPVTKIYPPKELGYSKMKPITGWWSILRPLIFLGLGIKK